jgi:hypothetical protein
VQIKSKPTIKTYTLKSDPDGQASVTIRQATFKEDMLRGDAFATRRVLWANHPSERTITEENRNPARMYVKDIYVTLVDAKGFLDENSKELFDFKENRLAFSEEVFTDKLGLLDADVVTEMHNCVLRTNPTWGTPTDEEQKTDDKGDTEKPEGESPATSG